MKKIKTKLTKSIIFFAIFFTGFVLDYTRKNQIHTELISAISNNDAIQVEALLNQGADVNATSIFSLDGNIDTIKRRILGIHITTHEQPTAILVALSPQTSGKYVDRDLPQNIPLLKSLLDGGAKINQRDEFGRTPIILASISGKKESVALLIKYGANVNDEAVGKLTPLIAATEAYGDKNGTIELLLSNGANVNTQDDEGWTALMYSITTNDVEIVRSILKYNPDLKIKNNGGNTALDIAVEYNSLIVIHIIKSYKHK